MSVITQSTLSGEAIVNQAKTWLGVPYLYSAGRGSATSARVNGVDCSSLVYQVFMALGMNVGTDTVSQMNNPDAQPVADLASAQSGDLVFFGSPAGGTQAHVGIYIGNGMMIDAPHTGASTRIDQVAGFGSILGIRRIATAGVANPATLTAASVAGTTGATTGATTTSTSVNKTLSKTLLELVAVAASLSLVVLGVLRSTKGAKPQ